MKSARDRTRLNPGERIAIALREKLALLVRREPAAIVFKAARFKGRTLDAKSAHALDGIDEKALDLQAAHHPIIEVTIVSETPGGAGMLSGTKKSGINIRDGSTRYFSKSFTPFA